MESVINFWTSEHSSGT